MKKYSKIMLTMLCLMATVSIKGQEQRPSSSLFLTPNAVPGVYVPFLFSDEGQKFPVRWGMDVAWMNEQNMRKGVNHIGKNHLSLVRSSFRTDAALVGDTALTSSQITALRERVRLANILGESCDLVLNSDQEAGVDTYYGTSGNSNVAHWTAMIDANVKYLKKNFPNHKVVGISPFNEPDYTNWKQGNKYNQRAIAKKLKEEYEGYEDVAMTAGNTLNCDKASEWYTAAKPYVQWGNTHQLAGTFDNYASFFTQVVNDGNVGYADELHNVGEAIVGAQYGMSIGVWWGFDSRARGEFCQFSNEASRIGYGENRSAWSSACVYRHDTNGKVKAFLGTSERQATTSTYLFVSPEREVYYDGFGPTREFLMEMPGGTAYQTGQTNAERVIDITQGVDVPPSVINGRYRLMSKAGRQVIAVVNGSLVHTSYAAGSTNQIWTVAPVDSRIGGDFSFMEIKNVGTGKYMNILNNSTEAKAEVIAFDAGNASNEQWALEYYADGYYLLKNRETGLYLESYNAYATSGTLIQNPRAATPKAAQLWRFVPEDAQCETTKPAKPVSLKATGNTASVALTWDANSDSDLDGYMILRRPSDSNKWMTIARKFKGTYYVDNTCQQDAEYVYAVKAIDLSENQSALSDSVTASTSARQDMIAQWQFDGSLYDNTVNFMDCAHPATPTFSTEHKSGDQALSFDGTNDYLQLPYEAADMEAMTITMWVNFQSEKSWSRLFDFGNGTNQYMFLSPNNGSVMRFAIKNGGDEQQISCTKLATSTWKHVAVTLENGRGVIYVDGEEAGSNNSMTITPADFRPSLNYIGRSQFSGDPLFKGYIDDVRIYNYALTQNQVKDVMGDLTNDIRQVSAEEGADTYYQLNGMKTGRPTKGVYIRKHADGKTDKVIVQ